MILSLSSGLGALCSYILLCLWHRICIWTFPTTRYGQGLPWAMWQLTIKDSHGAYWEWYSNCRTWTIEENGNIKTTQCYEVEWQHYWTENVHFKTYIFHHFNISVFGFWHNLCGLGFFTKISKFSKGEKGGGEGREFSSSFTKDRAEIQLKGRESWSPVRRLSISKWITNYGAISECNCQFSVSRQETDIIAQIKSYYIGYFLSDMPAANH